LIFAIDPTAIGYKSTQVDAFYRDLQGRLSEIPGVKSGGLLDDAATEQWVDGHMFHWPGTPEDQQSTADVLGVGPNFFETLHIPFLAGRGFNASDFKVSASEQWSDSELIADPGDCESGIRSEISRKRKSAGETIRRIRGDANRPASSGYESLGWCVTRNTTACVAISKP